MKDFYIIDVEQIISEKIEDDTVVINLETGCYYNLNNSASFIFSFFEGGNSKKLLLQKYQDTFKIDEKTAIKDINEIISYLIDKKLIIETSSSNNTSQNVSVLYKYIKPVIDEFSDMQEMLLLDPIHEVKAEGWPHKKDD